jgi:acetolactate synthase-1/2/3 large subunit
MAIGAALGDPETKKRPIVALLGDAGFGLAGIDCETAARLELPIVYLVTNNQGWMSAIRYITYGPNWEALGPQDQGVGQAFLPGIRYDKMGEALCCHGEHVEEPSQVRPALERAFKSAEEGKPAVVDVMVDPTLTNLAATSMAYSVLWGHVPYRELTKYGKAMRRAFIGFAFPGFEKYGIPDTPWPDGWEPIPPEMWER